MPSKPDSVIIVGGADRPRLLATVASSKLRVSLPSPGVYRLTGGADEQLVVGNGVYTVHATARHVRADRWHTKVVFDDLKLHYRYGDQREPIPAGAQEAAENVLRRVVTNVSAHLLSEAAAETTRSFVEGEPVNLAAWAFVPDKDAEPSLERLSALVEEACVNVEVKERALEDQKRRLANDMARLVGSEARVRSAHDAVRAAQRELADLQTELASWQRPVAGQAD